MEDKLQTEIKELRNEIYSLQDKINEQYDGWLVSDNILKRILGFSGYTILATLFFYFILLVIYIIFFGLILIIELF